MTLRQPHKVEHKLNSKEFMISLSASEKSTDRDFKYADDPIHMHNVPRSFCSSLFNFYNLIV